MKLPHQKLVFILLPIFLFFCSFPVLSQCNWTNFITDDFEYSTSIAVIVPNTLLHSTPNSLAARAPSAKGFYMNFVTGLKSNTKVFSRSFTVCPSADYRFNMWFDQVNGGSEVKFTILDSNKTVLHTFIETFAANSNVTVPGTPVIGWYNWISPTITTTNSILFFEITFLTKYGNNDFGMDDLSLEVCAPPILTEDVYLCYNQVLCQALPVLQVHGMAPLRSPMSI